jgi:hypothetical protein
MDLTSQGPSVFNSDGNDPNKTPPVRRFASGKYLVMTDKDAPSTSTGPADDNEELLDTPKASVFLDVSESFLVKARRKGTGPPFVRIGEKLIKYKKGTLRKYRDKREGR